MLFIFISVVPIITSMLYMSSVAIGQMTENVEQTSVNQLKNIDATIYEKYKNIKKAAENICENEEIQKILTDDNYDFEHFASQIRKCTADNEDIYAVACITNTGNAYLYNVNITAAEAIRMRIRYSRIDERPGVLTWFGNSYLKSEGFDEDMIMAVTTFNLMNENGGYKQAATIYIYIKNNIFGDAIGDVGDDSVVMLDGNGVTLSSRGQDRYTKLFGDDMMLVESMFAENEGIVKTDMSSKKNISFVHYSSSLTGFKYLKIYDNDVLYGKINSMKRNIVLIVILLMIVALMVYATIVNKITKPIVVLAERMKDMSQNKLDEKFEVTGNDEIAYIMHGYNRMLDKISDMISEVKEKEMQKKESDIRALSYQINPHFLHNTLASVRIVAMKHNDVEVSRAILDLNRILKSVFSKTSRKIVIKEEIKLLESFARLTSLRYNGRIEFSINADEAAENVIIPSMIIQPLLENAVMHGVAPKMKDENFEPKIEIDISKNDDRLKIVVSDNGVGMESERIEEALNTEEKNHGGVGLSNVNERIKLICGEEYGITIDSESGRFTNITITLPIE